MNLSSFSVKRPVTVNMFILGIILLGIISYGRLPQELFPSLNYPQITVATVYKGAAPQETEMLITKPIEENVGTVSGIKHIRSISKEELSMVMVEFDWGTNMDLASMAIREKLDLIKERLPQGANEPVVVKYNPFELPIIILNVVGQYPDSELLTIARKQIKNELEKIEGVASCVISGGVEKEVKVDVDQARLTASDLSIVDVVQAIQNSNLNYPAGTIEEHFYEQLIRTVGEFKDAQEINNVPLTLDTKDSEPRSAYKKEAIPLLEEDAPTLSGERQQQKRAQPGQKIIFVKDVASVRQGFRDKNSVARFNGKSTITIAIQKRAGANTVRSAYEIKKKLKELKDIIPSGVNIQITYDQSLFIKEAIDGVVSAAAQGGLLAFLVLIVFLRNWRSALMVTLSIPISVMFSFCAMYFKGLSLNMISLGGLALGIGMLVDNAIVVVENITRRRQLGETPQVAAELGGQEVAGAIFSSTLTTIIVFLPMIFIVGAAGQIFKELAFTVIVSLLASLLVAMTFIPAFAASQTKSPEPATKTFKRDSKPDFLSSYYEKFLKRVIQDKTTGRRLLAKIWLAFGICFVLTFFMDKEFMPAVDQGQFVVKVDLVPGTALKITDQVVSVVERYLLKQSDVASVTVEIGSEKENKSVESLQMMGTHQARLMVNLKPQRSVWAWVDFFGKYRHKSSRAVVLALKQYLSDKDLNGAEFEYVLKENVFSGAFLNEAPIVVDLKGYDLEYLKELALIVKSKLSQFKGVYGIKDSMPLPSPESKIIIDKDKAAVMGLSVSEVASAIQAAVEGRVSSKLKQAGEEIDIRVRFKEIDRSDNTSLRRMILRSPSRGNIYLADVAKITPGRGPTEIIHDDQQRVIKIWANLDKRSVSSVNEQIDKEIIAKLDIKPNYSVKLAGESLQMKESFASLVFALVLALVLVYMVMAGQFESFNQPFIIMFTIPLALIGVAAGLFISLTKLSVMVFLGAIVLGGVVVNNGIVLIDCINRFRLEGYTFEQAVIAASVTRLRPILMTAVTTTLGLLPLALALSSGAQLQKPMAVTIMGGLIVATFLSLSVIPLLYMRMVKRD